MVLDETIRSIVQSLPSDISLSLDDMMSLFLCGSLANDLGTPTSDVDLLSIVESPSAVCWRDGESRSYVSNNKRVELTMLSTYSYRDYMRRLLDSGEQFANGIRSDKLLLPTVIYGNHPHEYVDHFSYERYKKGVLEKQQKKIVSIYEDISGLKLNDDFNTFSQWTCMLLEHCVDAALLSLGDHYNHVKWRSKRVERTFQSIHPLLSSTFFDLLFNIERSDQQQREVWLWQVLHYSRVMQYITFFPRNTTSIAELLDLSVVSKRLYFVTRHDNKYYYHGEYSCILSEDEARVFLIDVT